MASAPLPSINPCLKDEPMTTEQKNILQRKREYLVDNFAAEDSVLDHFYQEGILCDEDCQIIRHERTRKGRCRKLLEFLPQRSEFAFHLLQAIISETGLDLYASPMEVDMVGLFMIFSFFTNCQFMLGNFF